PDLLRETGDVVISRDLAWEYGLQVGDPIILSDLHVGAPVTGVVRGIAYDTPNHQGDKVYYTLETAQALANGQPVTNTVIATTDHGQTARAALEDGGWSVDWVTQRRSETPGNLWIIGLRGAGILALLVSGAGIAHTMQVLLRRRQYEMAILKTLGYRQRDLRLIFTLEAGLLGLSGSLLGAGLGIWVSRQVFELVQRISSVLYQWSFSPLPPLMGVLVGTLTTLVFASWAILLSGQARPAALLRNEPVDVRRLPGCLTAGAGLGLLLAVPFTALSSLVMGSALSGVSVLAGILGGLVILGGFFSALLWICTHAIPLRRFSLARLAFHSLRRRGTALVFAMIALFIGVLSMSLGLVVAQISQHKISGGPLDLPGYNLNVLSTPDQENAIRQAIQALDPQKVGTGYRTGLQGLRMAGDGRPIDAMDAVLVGRSDPVDYLVSGAAWGSRPDGVYAYQGANLPSGSQVEVGFRDGSTRVFTVVGSYDFNDRAFTLYPPTGLLMTAEAFTRATRPDSLTYFVQFPPQQLDRAAADLGANLPQATVLNLTAYAARYMHSYLRLVPLPLAMAGLAMLAGLLLVANSVSLAMLDRRYEIGILKAMGYTRRHILSTFAMEYGLASLLATATGVLIIQGLLAVLAAANHAPASTLLLTLPSLALAAFSSVGLTLLTVLGMAWNPTRVSPTLVLNERTE
ncbi:MAG: FtsX-like permease family protein, partial [Chloroflexi bacterium]|nr:FtsX-like permease family protein [Chloroflexota bacterium]